MTLHIMRTISDQVDFKGVLAAWHSALGEFARGNPEPIKEIYSHSEDVTLANPFGATVRGWRQVADAIDFAASRFHEGDVKHFESLATFSCADMVMVFEIESWRTRVGDHPEASSFELRVTTAFRREGGAWKIMHRHSDPIRTFDPEGPLRAL